MKWKVTKGHRLRGQGPGGQHLDMQGGRRGKLVRLCTLLHVRHDSSHGRLCLEVQMPFEPLSLLMHFKYSIWSGRGLFLKPNTRGQQKNSLLVMLVKYRVDEGWASPPQPAHHPPGIYFNAFQSNSSRVSLSLVSQIGFSEIIAYKTGAIWLFTH